MRYKTETTATKAKEVIRMIPLLLFTSMICVGAVIVNEDRDEQPEFTTLLIVAGAISLVLGLAG